MPPQRPDGDLATTITDTANAVADAFDARVFAYSGEINRDGFGLLVEAMEVSDQQPWRPNSLLVLTTHGGLADAAYQIARLFQNTSRRFYLCIPHKCKSAGTLIALGATDLVMTSVSELGPLDVQLMQRDEIGQRRSGLVVRTALDGLADEAFAVFERVMLGIKIGSAQSVSFEVASRIAATIATGVMSPVYAQINPDALGNDLRDLRVATEYGRRLIDHGKNADAEAVRRLVEDYPAHGFIIDKAEAATLFRKVSDTDPAISALISALGRIVYEEQSPHVVARLDQAAEERDVADDGQGEGVENDAARLVERRETARRSDPARERAGEEGRNGETSKPRKTAG